MEKTDRLQLRFDHHSYRNVEEIKSVLETVKQRDLGMPWALEGEPIVFYYGQGGVREKAVLAIGLYGDGEAASAINGYFLVDIATLEDRVSDAESGITGLDGLVEGLRIKYDEDGQKIIFFNENKPDDEQVIDEIDASIFIKDGMLGDVMIINEENIEAEDPDGIGRTLPYILFKFKTNKHIGDDDLEPGEEEFTETRVRLPFADLLTIYKAGNGLELGGNGGNEFSIKIDRSSENYLSVGENGLKLSGINEAVSGSRTEVKANPMAEHLSVTSEDFNGKITYTINETNIASKNKLDELSGVTIEAVHNIEVESARTNDLFSRVSALTENDANLARAIQAEREERASGDTSIIETISGLTSGYTNLSAYTFDNVNQLAHNDEVISEDIDGLESDVDALDARIDTLEGHSINGIDPNDKMLTIANNLIASTLNIEYDAELKQIKFLGKNDALLGTINTSDFVIDGMINSVGVVEEGGVKYLRFVFNTDAGKQDIDIELTDLVTEYTIAEDSKPYLYIDGFEIGAKVNTTDKNGLATEQNIHDLEDIIGPGFNTESEQHTLTQKIRHIEEVLDEMPTSSELDEALEDIDKIKEVIAVQLKTKVVEPSANLKLSFFGFPSSDYIMVGERIQPVINVNYSDGKYISANGSETLAGCAVNPNSEKILKLNGEVIGTLGINQESPAITIQDGEYTASASVNYLEGTVIPTDAFGEPNESIRIPAGTIECETEKVIKAFRPVYYGPFDPSQYAEVNATTINTMITNGVFIPLTKYAWGEKEYITVPDGTKAFAVIVPSDGDRFVGGEVRAILDNKDHGFNIIDQFDKFNLPNVRTYTGDSVGYAYVAYVYQPATEMEESYFKVIY